MAAKTNTKEQLAELNSKFEALLARLDRLEAGDTETAKWERRPGVDLRAGLNRWTVDFGRPVIDTVLILEQGSMRYADYSRAADGVVEFWFHPGRTVVRGVHAFYGS